MQCHQALNTITRVLGRGNHSSGFACKDSVGIYNDLFAPNWYLDQVLTAATLGAKQEKQRMQPRTCSVCNANPTHVNMISFLTARKLKVHLLLFLSVTFIDIKLSRCWHTGNTTSRYSFGTFSHCVCLTFIPKTISSQFGTSCNSKWRLHNQDVCLTLQRRINHSL